MIKSKIIFTIIFLLLIYYLYSYLFQGKFINYSNSRYNKKKKSIVLLAAGPPKPNRKSRWLETFNNEILINTNIKACTHDFINLFITINKNDIDLINHVKKYYPHIIILHPNDEEWISTVHKFINISNDIIIVCGDIVNLKSKYIKKYLDTNYTSGAQKLKYRWTKKDIVSNSGRIQRGNQGVGIILISDKHKYILNDINIIQKTKAFANDFNANPSTKSGLFGGYMLLYFMEEALKLDDNVGYIYLDEDEPLKDND